MDEARSAGLVLLTAARDEVEHIEGLFDAVLGQRRRPAAWVLVDDDSSDGTADRAEELADPNDAITVLRRRRGPGERAEARAASIRLAYAVAVDRHPEAAFVAVLDADVALPAHGLSFLLDRFAEGPDLGVAAGVVLGRSTGRRWTGGTGPLQVFRRVVFDAIGGYRPLPDGGVDLVAAAEARLLGWRTQSFAELGYHHRRTSVTGGLRRALADAFADGKRDHSLGTTAPAALVDGLTGIADRPPLLASGARLAGYLRRAGTGAPVAVPDDLVAFLRAERRSRLGPPPARGTSALPR